MATEIIANICDIGGHCHSVAAERSWTVRQLKQAAEASSGTPWSEMVLLCGRGEGPRLTDFEPLEQWADGDAQLDLTLLRTRPRPRTLDSMEYAAAAVHNSPKGLWAEPHINEYVFTADALEYVQHDREMLDASSNLAGLRHVGDKAVIKEIGFTVAVHQLPYDELVAGGVSDNGRQLRRELARLAAMNQCPYLVQCYGSFATPDRLLVVSELMDCASIANMILRVRRHRVAPPVPVALCVAAQMLSGLSFLHERHTAHANLEPHNVMHNSAGEVKLTDFGLTQCRSPEVCCAYMAPEFILGEDLGGMNCSVWNFGMIFHELVAGKHGYGIRVEPKTLVMNVLRGKEPRLDKRRYSPELCAVVKAACVLDKSRRPDADGVLGDLQLKDYVALLSDVADWVCSVQDVAEAAGPLSD